MAGHRMLESFIQKRLRYFNADRNDPTKEALSNMSPWYHFGELVILVIIFLSLKMVKENSL